MTVGGPRFPNRSVGVVVCFVCAVCTLRGSVRLRVLVADVKSRDNLQKEQQAPSLCRRFPPYPHAHHRPKKIAPDQDQDQYHPSAPLCLVRAAFIPVWSQHGRHPHFSPPRPAMRRGRCTMQGSLGGHSTGGPETGRPTSSRTQWMSCFTGRYPPCCASHCPEVVLAPIDQSTSPCTLDVQVCSCVGRLELPTSRISVLGGLEAIISKRWA